MKEIDIQEKKKDLNQIMDLMNDELSVNFSTINYGDFLKDHPLLDMDHIHLSSKLTCENIIHLFYISTLHDEKIIDDDTTKLLFYYYELYLKREKEIDDELKETDTIDSGTKQKGLLYNPYKEILNYYGLFNTTIDIKKVIQELVQSKCINGKNKKLEKYKKQVQIYTRFLII